MPGYLERYEQGEREAVWTELAALGERVREPAVEADASAVAKATMQRALRNIEILIPRLRELGYKFQYPKPLEPPVKNTSGSIKKLEKILKGSLPLSLAWWWQSVGRVTFMGNH